MTATQFLNVVEEELSPCCGAEMEIEEKCHDPLSGTELAGRYERIELEICKECREIVNIRV